MPRMIELIRTSAVPSNLMQAAARGALSVPPAEMIEILVYLAQHNKLFSEKARMTLAGWDEAACRAIAQDQHTPKEVLDYLVAPDNLRPVLLPDLLENPSVPETALLQLAASKSSDLLDSMLRSARVSALPGLLAALAANPSLTEKQGAILRSKTMSDQPNAPTDALPTEVADGFDEAVQAFVTEHAAEINVDPNRPYQPIGGIEEIAAADHGVPPVVMVQSAAVATTTSGAAAATAPAKTHPADAPNKAAVPEERGTTLQKIAKLNIQGRIQLAMKGTKEERSLLIRDGTKLVALAVLESPKITDGEVEKIASQKNVLESVLRAIPMKRRFAKQYPIIRNLVANPRTPIDLSLGLMKNILAADLKNLAGNKEVSDTIRKLALKMFKQKSEDAKNH
jgi:hypothetical protein